MLKVSNGMGVNSVAMLVGLKNRGIRPDVILFANTGGERQRTLDYRPILAEWCDRVGFPQTIEVAYEPVRAPYTTLEGKCKANETLPSIAFGGKSCSLVFKKEPQEKWMRHYAPAQTVWARGEKVECAIGYDAGPRDMRRSTLADDEHYRYRYFLREWGWDRDECERQILAEGLELPIKSACWFCGAMKKHEVRALHAEEPHLFYRGIDMEDGARNGKHGLITSKGLGRTWSWREILGPVEYHQTKDECELCAGVGHFVSRDINTGAEERFKCEVCKGRGVILGRISITQVGADTDGSVMVGYPLQRDNKVTL